MRVDDVLDRRHDARPECHRVDLGRVEVAADQSVVAEVAGGLQLLHRHIAGRLRVELGQPVFGHELQAEPIAQRLPGFRRPPLWAGVERLDRLVGQEGGHPPRLVSTARRQPRIGRTLGGVDAHRQGVPDKHQLHGSDATAGEPDGRTLEGCLPPCLSAKRLRPTVRCRLPPRMRLALGRSASTYTSPSVLPGAATATSTPTRRPSWAVAARQRSTPTRSSPSSGSPAESWATPNCRWPRSSLAAAPRPCCPPPTWGACWPRSTPSSGWRLMPRSPPRRTRTRSTPTTSTSCAPRGSPGSPSGCRASDRTCSPPWIAPTPPAGHSSAWRGRGPPGLPTSALT